MDHQIKAKLREIYKQYGFELAKTYEADDVLVFTLKTGYFDNADIVPLSENSNTQNAFDEFQKIGFACTTRTIKSPEQAEIELFKGFFSVESILFRLDNDYKKFTSNIVAQYSENATYRYINAPYQINSKPGTLSPTDEIISRLDNEKPTLFLIEAAAGFGKTCTAYELVHELIKRKSQLPLFAELSRNRQAVIFRHILLDEIDNKFPTLSSKLVQSEMKNGRVITILDGFDELLRKSEEGNEFQNKEPMLETISEFLTGRAKIVLTTRRTVLFEGDAFHEWVDSHSDIFDIIRIKISEPKVSDWLDNQRLGSLTLSGIDIRKLANPVLLSYLRCIDDREFIQATSESQSLVEKYFDFMLTREMTRQDLKIPPEKQGKILKSIAEDMIAFGYTSETREYIVDQIERTSLAIIDEAIAQYPAGQKPTREGISNKLASHALLDRSNSEPNKIGFINEFAFGNYIGQVILESKDFLNDDLRFIEPTAISYQPRSVAIKQNLWNKLRPSLEFLTTTDQIDIASRIHGRVDFPLISSEAQDLTLDALQLGEAKIESFVFNECTFTNCTFYPSKLKDITFLNCRFFDNTVAPEKSEGLVHVLGGQGNAETIDLLIASNTPETQISPPNRSEIAERFVLEKFWPVGRTTISHKHRPIKGIVSNCGELKPEEVYAAVDSLKKRRILLEPIQTAFVEINFEEIGVIREILNKGNTNGK
jgi:hypothetical protein